jgi:hypothetical protein
MWKLLGILNHRLFRRCHIPRYRKTLIIQWITTRWLFRIIWKYGMQWRINGLCFLIRHWLRYRIRIQISIHCQRWKLQIWLIISHQNHHRIYRCPKWRLQCIIIIPYETTSLNRSWCWNLAILQWRSLWWLWKLIRSRCHLSRINFWLLYR